MATTKLILRIGLALLLAVGVGWVLGASGRSNSDRALQIADLRAELLEGRWRADSAVCISVASARCSRTAAITSHTRSASSTDGLTARPASVD